MKKLVSAQILIVIFATFLATCTVRHSSSVVLSGDNRESGASPQRIPLLKGSASIHRQRTNSLGLDRIDQESPYLDSTFTHSGTGRGVTVYVFDGGVSQTHPELAGRVRLGYTGFPNDPKVCNAHGTAVAGAIAGTNLGVAPEAEIVDVKMIQCDKLRGTIKAIVDGARWTILDHKAHPGPAVANWSFIADTAQRIPALDSAVTDLRAAGIPVIVAAGNLDIDACHVSPGNSRGAVVAGTSVIKSDSGRLFDSRADNTAYGDCITVFAPGDSVLLPSLDHELAPSSQLWNGTSMSTGYVSGAAALYLETHRAAMPDEVLSAILATATKGVVKDAKTAKTYLLNVRNLASLVLAKK